MARSAEALKRRALKRQRTEEEQRKADWKDALKQEEKNKKRRLRLETENRKKDDKDNGEEQKQPQQQRQQQHEKEQKEQNHKITSHADNNVAVSESNESRKRPETTIVPDEKKGHQHRNEQPQHTYGRENGDGRSREKSHNSKNQKHGSSTYQKSSHKQQQQQQQQQHGSNTNQKPQKQDMQKKHSWKPQAPDDIISRNNDLRERYVQYLASQEEKNGGEGGHGDDNNSSVVSMSPEDIERAKILIDRSRRKQEKKQRMKEGRRKRLQEKEEKAKMAPSMATSDSDKKDRQGPSSSSSKKSSGINHKAVRDQNRRLRKMYQDTGGTGMEPDQIERAKMLLARDERKKVDREKQSTSSSSKNHKDSDRKKNKRKDDRGSREQGEQTKE